MVVGSRVLRFATASGVLAAIALVSSSVLAQDEPDLSPQEKYAYGENETARSLAMGGALRALGNGVTAVWQNPADMAASRLYHLEALAQLTPEAGRQVYGGAIVDSMTSRLAGGIAVVGGFVDPDGIDRSYLDAKLALAFPITERLLVGISGRYSKITQDGDYAPLGGSRASRGLIDTEDEAEAGALPGRSSFSNTFTFDAGLTVKATEELHIAVLGQNLSYPNNGLLPTTFGGGVGYGTRDFSVEVDGLADFNSYSQATPRVMVGAEVLIADHFPIRAGYRYDGGAENHALSLGLGYVSKDFAVEVAGRRTLEDPGATTIVIGLAYYLESSTLGTSGGLD